ncbi:MAG: S24 family peptidase [Clostridia bacterium]
MKKIKKGKIKFLQKVKFKKVIISFIYVIIMICILYNILFLINTSISKKEYFKLYGFSFFCMKTNLMEQDISKNDLIIIKEADSEDLQNNDIIAYDINGKVRINKIVYYEQNQYTTKSNKNYYPDIETITASQIVGKKIANIPFLGVILELLQSKTVSIFTLVFLIFTFWYNRYMYLRRNERNKKRKKLIKL